MSPHISLYLPTSPRAFEQAGRVLPQRLMSALLEALILGGERFEALRLWRAAAARALPPPPLPLPLPLPLPVTASSRDKQRRAQRREEGEGCNVYGTMQVAHVMAPPTSRHALPSYHPSRCSVTWLSPLRRWRA